MLERWGRHVAQTRSSVIGVSILTAAAYLVFLGTSARLLRSA